MHKRANFHSRLNLSLFICFYTDALKKKKKKKCALKNYLILRKFMLLNLSCLESALPGVSGELPTASLNF